MVGFIPNQKTNNLYTLFWLSFLQKILEETAPESAQKNINLGIDLLIYTSGKSVFRDKVLKRQVTLNHPYPFDIGVIWSDPPRRMICLEPWTSPRNSFVDGFRNIMIPSNDSRKFNASIQIKSLK